MDELMTTYQRKQTVEAVQVTEENCERLARHPNVKITAHRPETFGSDWTIIVADGGYTVGFQVEEEPYLVRDEGHLWLIPRHLFENLFEPLEEEAA